jgi:pimeloyl-ACP methyl ester carboxylesterase
VKLLAYPLTALCDARIAISVSDAPPFGKVDISASMSLPWTEAVKYESHTTFTADSNGSLDLSKQRPDSGSCSFIDSMGPILSMTRVMGDFKDVLKTVSVHDSIVIDLKAGCGPDSASLRLERLLISPGLRSERINEPFVGELFYNDSRHDKTVIFLGGSSNEDLCTILPPAALMASHGFNVLALSFFGEKGLNSQLAEVPLEYFETVFTWLERSSITTCKEIYVYGASIGAVLALLLASRYPTITKVVAVNPLAWCFQGLTPKRVSLWTYHGESLPFIRFAWLPTMRYMASCILRNKPLGFAYMYRKSLEVAHNKEEARIRLEDANADILLFGGQRDGWWDSHGACLAMIAELDRHKYQHTYEYVTYKDGGHACYAPFVIPVDEFSSPIKLAPRVVLSEGVSREANAYMLEDSWERAIEFLKR